MRVRGWGPECEGEGEGVGVRVRGTLSVRREECGVLVVSRIPSVFWRYAVSPGHRRPVSWGYADILGMPPVS